MSAPGGPGGGYRRDVRAGVARGAASAAAKWVVGALLAALLGSNGAWLWDERNDVESGGGASAERSEDD